MVHWESHHNIPMVENFLFSLALLRSRDGDNMHEGMELLERLLFFQNNTEVCCKGNFPVSLHEYPQCHSQLSAVRLLPILFWIARDFRRILEKGLVTRVTAAIDALVCHVRRVVEERTPASLTTAQLGTQLWALGSLLGRHEWNQAGAALLSDHPVLAEGSHWYCPRHLGDTIVAVQMLEASGYDAMPTAPFWQHVAASWSPRCRTYVGPPYLEYQRSLLPEVTLYDVYMSLMASQPLQALDAGPALLHGALLHPCTPLKVPTLPYTRTGVVGGASWRCTHTPTVHVAAMQKVSTEKNSFYKAYHPLRVLWPHADGQTSSFVCQVSDATVDACVDGAHIELTFRLSSVYDAERRDASKEICFYLNLEPRSHITVEHQPATVFRLGDTVNISCGTHAMTLTFDLVEGAGDFCGHISHGNRPSQVDLQGDRRYYAHDWQLAVRTIHRTAPCVVRARLNLK